MNYGGKLINHMDGLIQLFTAHCRDRETLEQLRRMIGNRGKWAKGHDLFGHIRNKRLKAERAENLPRTCQYLFEEICAKTIYNLSGSPAPFDADSPYWIIPNALALARALRLPDAEVLKVFLPERSGQQGAAR